MILSAIISSSLLITLLSLAYILTVTGVIALIVMENRNPLKSLAWITVLLLLPAVGLIIYLFFGRNLRNRRMISRRRRRRLINAIKPDPQSGNCSRDRQLSPEAHSLVTVAHSLDASQFFEGNSARVFTSGAEKFEALKADIAEAESYILLQYYIIEDDRLGNEISDLLIAAARRGVSVRVIYDDLGSLKVANSFFSRMKEAGVEVHPFFKLTFPHFASRANWRNHRKLCVVDGRVGYIGGMNIAERYIDGGRKFPLWRDTHMRVTGPVVAALHYSFAVDWNFMGQPLIEHKVAEFKPSITPETCGMQLITGGPTDRWGNLRYWLIKAIATARKRVFIQTPYFLPSEGLLNALQVAALSRIDVRVMIPEHSDSPMLTYASRSYVQECLRAGIKVYFYKAGMLHSKMAIIDDDISTIGSTNFDFRSFEHNFEANMLIYSPDMNRQLRNIFDADQRHSTRIIFHTWRRRPILHKAIESVLRLLSPIL